MKIPKLLITLLTLYSPLAITQNTPNTTTCKFGQFLTNNQTCVECLLSCSKCTSLELPCAGCSEGFKLTDNSTQCSACGIGQQLCTQDSVTCYKFYKLVNKLCHPICQVENCGKCVSIFVKQCQQCMPRHILSPNKTTCQPITLNQPTITNNTNTTRNLQQNSPAFEAQTKTLNLTNSSNTTRNQSPTNLTTATTTVNQSTNPTINTECQISQFLNLSSVCQKCNVECSTCINSAEQCLSCNQGWVMMGWKCVTEEYLKFNVSLQVKEDQEYYVFGDGFNLIKTQLIKELLPSDYMTRSLKALSITSLIYDKNASSLNISGIVDKVGNSSLLDLTKMVKNRLKTKKSLGPFQLISHEVKASNSANNSLNSTPPPPNNKTTISPDLKAILIPSIILGVSLLVGIFICCCKCCRCCCFKKQKLEILKIEPYDSQRRRTMDQNNRGNQQMPVITPITPITTINPPKTTKQSRKNTYRSDGSIKIPMPYSQEKRMEKVVSMDSLDEMINRNTSKQKKIILNKQQTLKQSQLTDKEINSILPSSSNSKSSAQYQNQQNNSPIQLKMQSSNEIKIINIQPKSIL